MKRVRRIVITPNKTFTGAWRENTDSLKLLQQVSFGARICSGHPNEPVNIVKYDFNGTDTIQSHETQILPIELQMPDGGHVWIPASIVEKSIVICEVEPDNVHWHGIKPSYIKNGNTVFEDDCEQ